MKKYLIFFCTVISIISKSSFAQTITSSQLFPDSTIPFLSMGGNRMGWVTKTGNYFSHHYMDTLLNITSFSDTSLHTKSTNGFPVTGNTFCGSTMDKNGNLIGLFHDWAIWSALIADINTPPPYGINCYFLYDYATQQKNYFNFNDGQFWDPNESPLGNTNQNYKFAWSQDTLVICLGKYDDVGTNHGAIIKFLNLNFFETGSVSGEPVMSLFTDLDNKVNTFRHTGNNSYWNISDGIHYNSGMLPTIWPLHYTDAVKDSIGNLFIKYRNGADSLLIRNSTSDFRTNAPDGDNLVQSICVDHNNNLWLLSSDSVYIYRNNIWTAFHLDFDNFVHFNAVGGNAAWTINFFEYAHNKFVMSFNYDLYFNGGNGMIFFTFNDTNTVTNNSIVDKLPQIQIYPNPTANSVIIDCLYSKGKISIFDVLGNEVFSTTINNPKMNIDISNLSNGAYFVKINNTATRKLIKHS